tara:strand:- start:118 stop:447 length:330 start_codon:yes stop_codon:yes gene_type:complete
MNKTDAGKIAKTITYGQLEAMFEGAKIYVIDWSVISSVNKALTKGKVWNMLYPNLSRVNLLSRSTVVKNMIWEFGEFLPEELKIKKKVKTKYDGIVLHEEPVFDKVANI